MSIMPEFVRWIQDKNIRIVFSKSFEISTPFALRLTIDLTEHPGMKESLFEFPIPEFGCFASHACRAIFLFILIILRP